MSIEERGEEKSRVELVDAIYRLLDESMGLIENSVTQLARIECRGENRRVLKGPSYNIYVNLLRISDNLREIRRMVSQLLEGREGSEPG